MRLTNPTGPIGSGARTCWVTIQTRPDDPATGSGFPTDGSWSDLATVAMHRADVEVSEITQSDQKVVQNATRWEMPYMPEMDPALADVTKLRRLLYFGRAYDIIGASLIGRAALAIVTAVYPSAEVAP
jgi:Phage head-tail joining protein